MNTTLHVRCQHVYRRGSRKGGRCTRHQVFETPRGYYCAAHSTWEQRGPRVAAVSR